MELTDIHLLAYGSLKELHFENLPPGLCLFSGPNEAGKSTLLSFLRDMLFGFQEARGDKNIYDPTGKDRHGRLRVRVKDELYRVERISQRGDVRGTAQVLDSQGNPLREEDWRRTFGYPSRELYASIFAFGLKELEDLATLQGNEVSDRLYTLGTGIHGTSLPEVRKGLEEEAQRLYTRKSRRALMQILRKDLRAREEEIESIGNRWTSYMDLLSEIDTMEREIQELQGNSAVMRRRQQELQACLSVQDACLRLTKIEAILEDLAADKPLLEEWKNRVVVLEKEIERYRDRCRILDTEQDALRMRLKELAVDEKLLRSGVRLKMLEQYWHRIAHDIHQLPSYREQERQQAQQLLLQCEGIGKDWSSSRLEGLSLGMDTIHTFTNHAKHIKDLTWKLSVLQQAKEDVSQSIESARQKRFSLEEELNALDEGLSKEELDASENAVSRWWNHRRERDEAKRLLDAAHYHNHRRTIARTMGLVGTLTSLLVGLSLALWVFFATQEILWALGSGLAGLGILGMVFFLFCRQHLQEAPKDTSLQNLLRTERIWEKSTEEMKEISHDLLGETVLDEEVFRRRTEAYLHDERERRGTYFAKKEQLDDAVQYEENLGLDLLRRKEEIRTLEEDLLRVQTLFSSWLTDMGLPQDLQPEAVEPILSEIRSARAAKSTLDETRNKIARLEEEVDHVETELNHILEGMGQSRGTDPFETRLNDLLTRLEDCRRNQDLQGENEAVLAAKRREWFKTQEELNHSETELREILSESGCKTSEAFRSRIADEDRRKDLEREAKGLRREIAQRAKRLGTLEEILTFMESTDELRVRSDLKDVEKDLDATERSLSEWRGKRGRLQERQSLFTSDEQLRVLQQSQQSIQDEIVSRAEEWTLLTTALYLLDETRQRFEAEHQPSVLAQATSLFKEATQGRWVKVQQVLGEEKIEVEDREGQRIEARFLSRGTCELLYLALRFALVQELSQRSEPLPILLDDCLVNMDPERLKGAVKIIDQAAQRQQVLAFTCHPHIVQSLQKAASVALHRILS